MKLLLITAIEEYEKDVKKILKHSGIKVFSVQPVQGYKNESNSELHNWFVSDEIATASLLFTVFAESKCVNEIFEAVSIFNQKQEIQSKIHLASLELERSV